MTSAYSSISLHCCDVTVVLALTCFLFCFVDVTVSPNSDLEQLHIKSSDTNIPSPLRHNYLLSAPTSDDIKQWYRALQESRLLDNSVLSVRKRSQPGPFVSKEVCINY